MTKVEKLSIFFIPCFEYIKASIIGLAKQIINAKIILVPTLTEARYDQVLRMDGSGDYRLVSNPQSGQLLETANPFTNIDLFPYLVDNEVSNHEVTYTTDACGRVYFEPGKLKPRAINLVGSEEGLTVIYYDIDSHNPRCGNKVEFHMMDVGPARVDSDNHPGQLLFDEDCKRNGRLDLTVGYFREPQPWFGRINLQGSYGVTIQSSVNLLNLVLASCSITPYRMTTNG